MPPARSAATPDDPPRKRPTLMIRLGEPGVDDDLVVPEVGELTLKERFAIRSTTGMAPEQLWAFTASEPLGRDRLAVWYWVAHARANGSGGAGLPPLKLIEDVLDAGAAEGKALYAWAKSDDDEAAEGEGDVDPEG